MNTGHDGSLTTVHAKSPDDALRRIELLALMAGVELDPPPGSVRWGRRVCAGAVERGVVLRPLGDVVVVMPPLTTTVEEIDRVTDVLGRSIGAVWAEDHG